MWKNSIRYQVASIRYKARKERNIKYLTANTVLDTSKKLLRYILYTIAGIILFIGIYLLLSQILPYLKVNADVPAPENGITIYIESNGVHTDFVMPVKTQQTDWNQLFSFADFEKVDGSYRYVAAGWGDKGFFIGTPRWADLKFSTAFKAAFGLSSTAMHITYKHYEPRVSKACAKLVISQEQYNILVSYIKESFEYHNGRVIRVNHTGYSYNDCFYEANGTYSLFKTCNVWTGRGLKKMGIRIGIWTPFQGGIMEHLSR